MRRVLSLPTGESRTVADPWGATLTLNDRVIQKALDNAPRTHAVAWLCFAIANAIELWEKPVETKLGIENRTYHLAAVNDPEKRSVVVISSEGVVFNVIDCDTPYVENLRCGTLLRTRYEDNRRYCTSHDCCDDVVEMEKILTKKERERKLALEEAADARKRLNMKNPPAKPTGERDERW